MNDIVWEVEKWSGVAPEVTGVMKILREGLVDEHNNQKLQGLTGRYETEYGLTDPVPIRQGLGQGDALSPTRSKLMLAVIQRAINRLCPGCPRRLDGRRLALIMTDNIHTMQLAFECAWLVTQIMGISLQVKLKKKTCWAGTYWENRVEKDITGWEMKLPDETLIPQLIGTESYKYLGTELRAGWADGLGQVVAREKVVRKCRQLIGLIGRTPLATMKQMESAIGLAISGTIGYYCRSTVLTWADAVQIEKARVSALSARGFTDG